MKACSGAAGGRGMLLGGCRSASTLRSDKTQENLVGDLQDLNPLGMREKGFIDDNTRSIGTLSQDTAQGVAPRMDPMEGVSDYAKDDIRSTKEKMEHMEGCSINKETGLDKEIKDERNRQNVFLEEATALYKQGPDNCDPLSESLDSDATDPDKVHLDSMPKRA